MVDYIYNSPRYRRWGVLIIVLLGTGMRIGEALGLRWRDCDFVFLNSNDKVFTPAVVFEMLQSVVCDYNRDEAFAAKKEGKLPKC